MTSYERATPERPHVQVRARDEGHHHGARVADVVVRPRTERALTPGFVQVMCHIQPRSTTHEYTLSPDDQGGSDRSREHRSALTKCQ